MSTPSRTASRGKLWLLADFIGGQRMQAVIYMVGMVLLLVGERIIGGEDALRWTLDGLGLLGVLLSLGLVVQGMGKAGPDERGAHMVALWSGVLGLAAVGLYSLQSDMVVAMFNFAQDQAEQRYTVVINAIWPVVWLVGTLAFLFTDRVLAANPAVVMPARAREAAIGGVGLALALAMLFPLNYVASDMNKRWDFGYFKTARPGTATESMVAGLDQPVTAYLFFPTASDVTEELRTYFDTLSGGQLKIEYVDQALEPELAKELKVRDNGYIAVVRGEGDDQQVEKVKIGKDFDSAKRKLKKLDSEFQKALLKIAHGQKIAYFTVGHGEMYWKAGTDPERKLGNFKKVLQALNYRTKELGLSEGLGNEVPEDASVVFVMGPKSDFLPEELTALDRYRQAGGSLLIALEPGGPDMSALLTPLGVKWNGQGTLASETRFVPRTNRIADRVNLFTNKYSTHESVTTLSRNSRVLYGIIPGAGALSEDKTGQAPGNKVTVTIRSLDDAWMDLDGDLEFDADAERRKVYSLAMAASGPLSPEFAAPKADEPEAAEADEAEADEAADGDVKHLDVNANKDADTSKKADATALADDTPAEYRAIVMADSTWASDLALPLDTNKGNFQMALDGIAWLGRELDSAGTVQSEEDVKIQHTKAGQGWWFYGTAFFVPFGLLGAGLMRLRVRRKRGRA